MDIDKLTKCSHCKNPWLGIKNRWSDASGSYIEMQPCSRCGNQNKVCKLDDVAVDLTVEGE